MDPTFLATIVVSLLLIGATVVLLMRSTRRADVQDPATGFQPASPVPFVAAIKPAPAPAPAPRLGLAGWQAAGPLLEAMGLRQLDAECYTSRIAGSSESLFVEFHPGNGTLGGWSEGTYPGGALELFVGASIELKAGTMDPSSLARFVIGEAGWVERPGRGGALEGFLGAEAELHPREPGQTELAHFVASQVREIFGGLPPAARLRVEAPEIPADDYRLTVSTPFSTPEQASIVARVLVTLDEAAQRPLPAASTRAARSSSD